MNKRIVLAPQSLSFAIREITWRAKEEGRWQILLGPVKRSQEQNAKFWACLTDISEQVVWHGVKLSPDEWKDVMTAALKRSKVVPGIDGGFVVLGQHTSSMGKAEFSELLELTIAFGSQHGVVWTEQG